jgi:hypothetical protein
VGTRSDSGGQIVVPVLQVRARATLITSMVPHRQAGVAAEAVVVNDCMGQGVLQSRVVNRDRRGAPRTVSQAESETE